MDGRILYNSLIFTEVKIPVIVVFTKYDVLFNEHYRNCSHLSSRSKKREEAGVLADRAFREYTKGLKFPFVHVQVLTSKVKETRQKQKEDEGLLINYIYCPSVSF